MHRASDFEAHTQRLARLVVAAAFHPAAARPPSCVPAPTPTHSTSPHRAMGAAEGGKWAAVAVVQGAEGAKGAPLGTKAPATQQAAAGNLAGEGGAGGSLVLMTEGLAREGGAGDSHPPVAESLVQGRAGPGVAELGGALPVGARLREAGLGPDRMEGVGPGLAGSSLNDGSNAECAAALSAAIRAKLSGLHARQRQARLLTQLAQVRHRQGRGGGSGVEGGTSVGAQGQCVGKRVHGACGGGKMVWGWQKWQGRT